MCHISRKEQGEYKLNLELLKNVPLLKHESLSFLKTQIVLVEKLSHPGCGGRQLWTVDPAEFLVKWAGLVAVSSPDKFACSQSYRNHLDSGYCINLAKGLLEFWRPVKEEQQLGICLP